MKERHGNTDHSAFMEQAGHDKSCAKLREVLRGGRFFICLQPKLSMPEKHVVGAEAFLRLEREDGGIVFPFEFIRDVEKEGFMDQALIYMFGEVCRVLRKWIDEAQRIVPLSLYIPERLLLTPGFIDDMGACLKSYNIPPALVELDLDACVLERKHTLFADILHPIERFGAMCAIDRFDKNASEVLEMNAYGIQSLKLDCDAYTTALGKEGMKLCIEAYHAAEALHMQIAIKCIKKQCQVEQLLQAGCKYMQGHALAMPVPVRIFEKFMLPIG